MTSTNFEVIYLTIGEIWNPSLRKTNFSTPLVNFGPPSDRNIAWEDEFVILHLTGSREIKCKTTICVQFLYISYEYLCMRSYILYTKMYNAITA